MARVRRYWKLLTSLISLLLIAALVNFAYQVWQKPEEVLTVLPFSEKKTPNETWRTYREDFKEHAFGGLTPQFLAALSHVESAGDRLASPAWKWSWSVDKLYAPASTSFGILQLTRPTAKFAANLCKIKNGRVQQGDCAPWFLNRASVSQSVEISAKNMVYSLQRIFGENYRKKVSRTQILKTATLIHLCGERVARRFARAKFNFSAVKWCGSHSPYKYWLRVNRIMKRL